jgi:nitrite reductase (NADH) small subunit
MTIKLCALDDIPVLGSRVVQREGGDIAVFRNAKDEVYALDDRCAHKQGPLSQGIVHGDSVTCPLHGWQYTLADGVAKAPDEGRVRSYPVRVENGCVYLDLA